MTSFLKWFFLSVAVIVLSACAGDGNDVGTDTSGNVNVDTTPPVITLNGNSTLTLFQGEAYIEQGASASDDVAISVSVVISGTVETATVGTYTITYSATDPSNNTSTLTRVVSVVIPSPFITTWRTDNAGGVSANNQIKITTIGGGYNYTIDWGDTQVDNNVTTDITHTYAIPGTYTVSISGDFPQIYFPNTPSDNTKLLSVEQWGNNRWRSMINAFNGCTNLVVNAADFPDLSQVLDMNFMFSGASAFNQPIDNWDVSNVSNMTGMFRNASSFNQGLSSWDVSSVGTMDSMFEGASAFNQNLSSWNTSSLFKMNAIFKSASSFNQDISTWDVLEVTSMANVFEGASSFNQDISGWDVSSVEFMDAMFLGAAAFNQPLNNWNVTSLVSSMVSMFDQASAFNQDISSWDVSSVESMENMFRGATAFNQSLSTWTLSSAVNMSLMFNNATAFNQPIGGGSFLAVTNFDQMFDGATAFDQNIGGWQVSTVTSMNNMFNGVTLSTANYDALLVGWSPQSVLSGVTFSAGASRFSNAAQSARDTLTIGNSWTITDGGLAP